MPSPKPPTTLTDELDNILRWILDPSDPVSLGGYYGARRISEQLAKRLAKHPYFSSIGYLEHNLDGHIYLWLRQDWKEAAPYRRKQQEESARNRAFSCWTTEASKIAYARLRVLQPSLPEKLAHDMVEFFVRRFRENQQDPSARQFLAMLGFFEHEPKTTTNQNPHHD